MRKIIHIDMDAFFASVEQLDNPELRGKPVAVGGNSERGVIAAASYEARKFGVKSAMSSRIAARLCPDLIFVKPRFNRYKEISSQIFKIYERYTDLIEPLSLDEAYLDVTSNKIDIKSATFIAQSIKTEIKEELQLIASAGVSYNKFLAKLASDQDKPDGLYVIRPEEALQYIERLPVKRIHGVGNATADKLHEMQIFTGKDILLHSEKELEQFVGKIGHYLYLVARGIDNRPVVANRERKSVASETTLNQDIFDTISFTSACMEVLESLLIRMNKIKIKGRTLSLKLKYSDFTIQSKSFTKPSEFIEENEFQQIAQQLIEDLTPLEKSVRLIGFQLSNFEENNIEDSQLKFDLK